MSVRPLAKTVRRARPQGWGRRLVRLGLLILGGAIVLLGALIAPLPGPMGVPVMLVGLVLMLRSSYGARKLFIRAQRRWPKVVYPFRRLLRRNPEIAPVFWQQMLRLEKFFLKAKASRFAARTRRRFKPRAVWRSAAV